MTGDIFIHAGDFTDYGREEHFTKFFDFLDKLKFKHKIVISGNHEIILDNGCMSIE
jgi:3',5'-cyclic AMP phosphodiesterase CpdA